MSHSQPLSEYQERILEAIGFRDRDGDGRLSFDEVDESHKSDFVVLAALAHQVPDDNFSLDGHDFALIQYQPAFRNNPVWGQRVRKIESEEGKRILQDLDRALAVWNKLSFWEKFKATPPTLRECFWTPNGIREHMGYPVMGALNFLAPDKSPYEIAGSTNAEAITPAAIYLSEIMGTNGNPVKIGVKTLSKLKEMVLQTITL